MVTIIATPGASNANSYITEVEADAYFDARLPLVPPWSDAADPTAALAMATRTLDAMALPYKYLVKGTGGSMSYYITRPAWTGTPATATQRLAWPRIGMFDGNGNPIPSNVIPEELKEATAEFAGQLVQSDTTLDNAVIVQGLKSVKAGSVALSFKDMIEQHVIPDMVWNLMPSSWFTDEIIEPAWPAMFDVL
jgi:hypothetical protein